MWARILSALLGLWLMAAPAALGTGPAGAVSDRIAGPLAATFAVIAAAEVVRPVRWANLPLGLWIALAPLVLGYGGMPAANGVAVGLLLCALCFVRGRVEGEYGGGWSALWRGGAADGPGT